LPHVNDFLQEAEQVSTNASTQSGLAAIHNLALIGYAIDERSR
jgi:hypothetical protein